MTDEEMAEEYAKLNARQYIHNDGIGFCTSEEEVKQAFLAGLEAGRPKWHDLRKDPKDLPPVHSSVFNEDCDKVTYIGEGRWETYSEYYEKYVEADPPVAWCEISTFNTRLNEDEVKE